MWRPEPQNKLGLGASLTVPDGVDSPQPLLTLHADSYSSAAQTTWGTQQAPVNTGKHSLSREGTEAISRRYCLTFLVNTGLYPEMSICFFPALNAKSSGCMGEVIERLPGVEVDVQIHAYLS